MKVTPKRVLLAHIRDMHARLSHVNDHYTQREIARLHAQQHHRFLADRSTTASLPTTTTPGRTAVPMSVREVGRRAKTLCRCGAR